jgi:hypothetical protein
MPAIFHSIDLGGINSFQHSLQKLFIGTIRINIVKGPYEFLQPLMRLTQAYHRFERTVWAMNAAILSIAVYALAEIIGLPGFMSFYYQDVLLLAASPAILSIILGLAGATLIKRRKKADIFPLLGPQLINPWVERCSTGMQCFPDDASRSRSQYSGCYVEGKTDSRFFWGMFLGSGSSFRASQRRFRGCLWLFWRQGSDGKLRDRQCRANGPRGVSKNYL